MATVKSILTELKSKGKESTRKTYSRHGVPEDRTFGVSVADLKVIAKGIKGEQQLALDLFETGNSDAMYLAGMVANGREMTMAQLQAWAKLSRGLTMLFEYSVPWVAVESPHAHDLAMKFLVDVSQGKAALDVPSEEETVSNPASPDEVLRGSSKTAAVFSEEKLKGY